MFEGVREGHAMAHFVSVQARIQSLIRSGRSPSATGFAPNTLVQCTLVQALRLCTGRTAHRASRGIALLLLDHGTRRG